MFVLLATMPLWAEWLGWVASLLGALLALWAGCTAKGAKEQARLAKEAAIQRAHATSIGDLIAELKTIPQFASAYDWDAVAAKAQHVRGRLARFETDVYSENGGDDKTALASAVGALKAIVEAATAGRRTESTRAGRVRVKYGDALEAMERVYATQERRARGEA